MTYSTPQIDHILSRQVRSETYHRILSKWIATRLAAAEGSQGRALSQAYDAIHASKTPTVEAWDAQIQITRHETAAWVDLMKAAMDEQILGTGNLLWQGLTSSNLSDSADALLWREISDLFRTWSEHASSRIRSLHFPPRVGRTHGQRAEIVNTPHLWMRIADEIGYGAFSPLFATMTGPVGQGDYALSRDFTRRAGLVQDMHPTQTTSRIQYTQAAWTMYRVIGLAAQFALNVRLLAREGLAAERFVEGEQKGSSSMPHKRNPITAERICGLERVARGYFMSVCETGFTQWEERDLTNSSVERVAFWGLVRLTGFILTELNALVSGLAFFEDGEAQTWEGSADALNSGRDYYEIQKGAHDG